MLFRSILGDKGVYGTALDLVTFDKEYENVFSSLMGSTVVVDNLETAINLSKKYSYKHRIVTLEGDMIVPQGSISGGSRKQSAANILSLDREIKEIETKITQLEEERNKVQSLVEQLSQAKTAIEEKIKEISAKKLENEIAVATAAEKLSKAEEFIEIENNNLKKTEEEKVQTQARIRQINTILESTASSIKELADKKANTQSSVSVGQGEYEVLKSQQDSLQEKRTDVRVKLSTLTANMDNAVKQLERIDLSLKQGQTDISSYSKQILENKEQIAMIDADLTKIAMQDLTYAALEEVKKRLVLNEQDKVRVKEDFERADKDKTDYAAQENILREKKLRDRKSVV